MSKLKKIAAVIGLAAMFGSAAANTTANSNNIQQKDIVSKKTGTQKTIPQQITRKTDNPYKYTRTPKGNQRQYRKWLAQNPHMRKSKKNKLRK